VELEALQPLRLLVVADKEATLELTQNCAHRPAVKTWNRL